MKNSDKGDDLIEAKLKDESETHVCKECDKRFSSGKALGGHMSRTHVQGNDDRPKKQKSRIYKKGESDKYACSFCDRVFYTDKALFGHMRSHPERSWRGMVPERMIKSKPEPESEFEEGDWQWGLDMDGYSRTDVLAATLLVNMRYGYYSMDTERKNTVMDSSGAVKIGETGSKGKKLERFSSSPSVEGQLSNHRSKKLCIDLNVQALPEDDSE